jgi:hypothetical protein
MAAQLPASSRHTNNRGSSSPPGLGGGQLLGLEDDDRHEEFEERAEPLLLGRRRVQVQGVVGPGQQLVQVQVAALGRGRDHRVAEHVQQGLGGAVDRTEGVLWAAGAGRPGIQGLLVADLHQRLGDIVDVLDVDPAGDIGHRLSRPRRSEEED